MEERTKLTGERIRLALGKYPQAVSFQFDESWSRLSDELDGEQLERWAEVGLQLADQTVRSWEAANEYFRVSPKVAGVMPFNYFLRWMECGRDLCTEAPSLAASYFQASPGAMGRLRSRHIVTWADMGRSLYKGTWKSSTLACKFFEASPDLLSSLTVPELEQFVTFLDGLSRRSYDMAVEVLALGKKVFPLLDDDKGMLIAFGSSMADTSWRSVKGLFDATSRSLPNVRPEQRLRFLELARGLHNAALQNIPAAMVDMSTALGRVDAEHHSTLLGLAESMMSASPAAVPEFVKSSPVALERVTLGQLESWHREGMGILADNGDGGLAYFRIESSRSLRVLESLSSSVEFARIKDLMEMYCRALAGADVELAESEDLTEKNIGWVSKEAPTTEGTTVFVPSTADRYATKPENFSLFKVISTHQVAHLEFGSFEFEYDRPSTLFEDLRPKLAEQPKTMFNEEVITERDGSAERGWITDMQRFFDIFEDRRLALDIFTVVEDARLDTRVMIEYPGIKAGYLTVQQDAVQGRPQVKSLPAREALVEFFVRVSLGQTKGLPVPSGQKDAATKISNIARRAQAFGAFVEDSAEATLRVYAIVSKVPNEQVPDDDWENLDLPDEVDSGEDESDEGAVEQLTQGSGDGESGEDEEYTPSEDVDYRGDFKPELVQMLTQLRMQEGDQGAEAGSEAITQEMVEEMLQSSAEVDTPDSDGAGQESMGAFADNLLKEAGLGQPQTPGMGQGPLAHTNDEGGPLDATEPQTFVYDEWDFRAADYKPDWCIIREKTMAEGDAAYFGETLHSYGPLASQIRRQFEMLVPESFRKVRRLEDGEEIDIDDVIEAVIDARTGSGSSDKIYWSRNKVQRDVAVVFLLDTSASTAEAIEESKKVADDWEAPEDPVEYMVWLRGRRGEGIRRSYKRIIDLEKEAVVLLIHALEATGDLYGIYGFSGYGRENVEFYTVKEIDEAMSERVQRRIDRIAPLHATRMGPAIRHATMKLEAQDARTKLLFLISDGRPQDRGYSREGVEKEYAVHDTKMALDEAKEKNINAFCLTVDKNGHDYLKTMTQDMGYEVLDDIYELPERLLYLYRRLTI